MLVRVCDVARQFADSPPAEPLVWAHLRTASPRWRFYEKARDARRLLVLLDGFDEAGALAERFEAEIAEVYASHPLVVTSREMKCLKGPAFARFRRVRVLQLDQAQISQIATKRLGDDARAKTFLAQLKLNAALQRMAKNPLLLSVTLTVFETRGSSSLAGETLNRGLVYAIALDSMLTKLDGVAPDLARRLAREVAWAAHSKGDGAGTRDFGDDLALDAAARCGPGAADAWREIADAAQRGRLPLLAWFTARGDDRYRFAHLTFQEFLTAERVLGDFDDAAADADDVAKRVARLCTRPAGRPSALFERGWWQQVVQMFGDLAGPAKSRHVVKLADAILGEEGAEVDLAGCVGDRNAMTLAALLPEGRDVVRFRAADGGLGEAGCGALVRPGFARACLRRLDLSGNLLDGAATVALCDALTAARCPLEALDLAANRLCVGPGKRPGFETETFHSRKRGGSATSKLYLDYMYCAAASKNLGDPGVG